MGLKPIYTVEDVKPVHNLRFDWTGWFRSAPPSISAVRPAIESCRDAWRSDGFECDAFRIEDDFIQILANTQPNVPPRLFTQRLKGRLQHALRQQGIMAEFSRKVAFRSLGDNTRNTVENYIDRQAFKSDYVDPRYKEFLGQFAVADPSIHLAEASLLSHGRYWYNLHLVIVVEDRRNPVTRTGNFLKLRSGCIAIAQKKGYAISHLAVMPDHIHLALRGAIDYSPEDIALAFLNNLSFIMGYNRCWSWEYYVGTFSEYAVGAIR